MDALTRHYNYMKNYVYYYGKDKKEDSLAKFKTDFDILKESYQFLPEDEEFILDEPIQQENELEEEYGKRLALSYYSKLHREFALIDLSRFETGKYGLCWRNEEQVVSGKGQFVCGNLTCNEKQKLKSFELNFTYEEKGAKKAALVKVRLCTLCSYKLNYKKFAHLLPSVESKEDDKTHKKKEKKSKKKSKSIDKSEKILKKRKKKSEDSSHDSHESSKKSKLSSSQ